MTIAPDVEALLGGLDPTCDYEAPECERPATRAGICPVCRDVIVLCESHAARVRALAEVYCEAGTLDGSCSYVGPGESYGWLPL